MKLTKQEEEPGALAEQSLIPRDPHPLRIHVVPEEARLRLFILLVVDIVILVVPLDPVASPERVHDMLSFSRCEEDLSSAEYGRVCFSHPLYSADQWPSRAH